METSTACKQTKSETEAHNIDVLLYRVCTSIISSTENLIRSKELELLELNVKLTSYKENALILKDNKNVREFILKDNKNENENENKKHPLDGSG